jgi:hypothetical protein
MYSGGSWGKAAASFGLRGLVVLLVSSSANSHQSYEDDEEHFAITQVWTLKSSPKLSRQCEVRPRGLLDALLG